MVKEKLVDAKANDHVVDLNQPGKTNRSPGHPLDARSPGEMVAFQAL